MIITSNWTTFRHHFATTSILDDDGVEEWPLGRVRANGFDDGFTGIDIPITEFPIDVSVNSGANGALAYHVYLSQRTDEADNQYMSVTRKSGKSGTFTIALTANAVTELGLDDATDSLTTSQLIQLLKDCTLYVKRLSDGAIQLVNMLEATVPGST